MDTNSESGAGSPRQSDDASASHRRMHSLLPGNREIFSDLYIGQNIENEAELYAFNVYVRLNARRQSLTNVSFRHSIFDSCYFNNCVFNSCDFTGCRFVACNFHQSAFTGCKFEYAIFERSHVGDDILSEAPAMENLKMRFARTLRMNFQQIGDARAVNKAISLELEATSSYLKKSWSSSETYYREKYSGWKRIPQAWRWLKFRLLDAIWGNGENTWKLLRAIIFVHFLIGVGDTVAYRDGWSLRDYALSLQGSPSIFFGIAAPTHYPAWILALIAGVRLIAFAFLTAILVKRFGRR